MKGFGTKLMMLALLVLLMAGCASQPQPTVKQEQNVQQAAATAVPSEKPAARIVSTTVAITQMLDLLGIDDVVGIPSSSKTLPSRYDGVKKVGNPMSPDMEIVKSLKPTEVLSVTTLQYELEPVFKNVGVDATFLNLTSLGDMQQAIVKLGEKYDRVDRAKEIVKSYDDKIAEIRSKTEGRPAPTVLILLGVPGSYLVATEHSYIGDLVKLAGGVNIVQGEKVEYLASNTEYLQQANPDVILRAAHGMPEEVVKMFDEEFKKNDIWKHFNAVKNGRVYDLEEMLFGTTGNLAANEALDALMGMLYP
ncbi:heme ABC transporter substrate-binding protein IsdE [Paenibacillus sp. NPDC058174]|uniref:heme ABC transporter substrate-binding protein IsdE n=1 Tax=Paenibacillus sp. NPDC058174 TaxID=3346366 RepID=UPI0036D826AD